MHRSEALCKSVLASVLFFRRIEKLRLFGLSLPLLVEVTSLCRRIYHLGPFGLCAFQKAL